MKRNFITLFSFCCLLLISVGVANAQQRTKITDGLYIVQYGNTTVIEDDINQRSIKIEVKQESSSQNNNEKMYNVICGKWSRRVVKDGLKTAIAAGIAASGTSGGTSLIVSAASTLALYIYDDVCDYYGEKK